jgi:hypothetical protein
LLQAADEAYAQGMGDVMLVTAGIAVACGLVMAIFLPVHAHEPARATSAETAA